MTARVSFRCSRRGHSRYRHAMPLSWSLPFLESPGQQNARKCALIILNQPFSLRLLQKLWASTQWHCCADGGANRLHDVLTELRSVDHAASEQDSRTACVVLRIQGLGSSNLRELDTYQILSKGTWIPCGTMCEDITLRRSVSNVNLRGSPPTYVPRN